MEHLRNIEKVWKTQLVYDNALGVERDENECVYLIFGCVYGWIETEEVVLAC